MTNRFPDFDTLVAQAGRGSKPDPYGAHTMPIYQTSTFVFPTAESGGKFFAGDPTGASHGYTRLGNPTVEAWERVVAAMEGYGLPDAASVSACAFGSGMAAITTAILVATRDEVQGRRARVIAQQALYGCASEFLENQASDLGIDVVFVNGADTAAFARELAMPADLVYLESPANPTLALTDIEAVTRLAHKAGARVAVDNTFASPYHQRPMTMGVDIVLHSTTKYLGGHGTVIGGIAVVRDKELAIRLSVFRKNFGGVESPFDAWLLLNGVKTFSLRMERHSSNAMTVANFLEKHPNVASVAFPGLPSHPQHALAAKQMERGFGSIMAFELKGGYAAAVKMIDRCELCVRAVSLGTVDTLIEHPASMTHSVMSPEMRNAAGITEGLVRLSVGIEGVDAIVADLKQALG